MMINLATLHNSQQWILNCETTSNVSSLDDTFRCFNDIREIAVSPVYRRMRELHIVVKDVVPVPHSHYDAVEGAGEVGRAILELTRRLMVYFKKTSVFRGQQACKSDQELIYVGREEQIAYCGNGDRNGDRKNRLKC